MTKTVQDMLIAMESAFVTHIIQHDCGFKQYDLATKAACIAMLENWPQEKVLRGFFPMMNVDILKELKDDQ